NSFATIAATCGEIKPGRSTETICRFSLFFVTAGAGLSLISSPPYCAANLRHNNALLTAVQANSPAIASEYPRRLARTAAPTALPANEPGSQLRYGVIARNLGVAPRPHF